MEVRKKIYDIFDIESYPYRINWYDMHFNYELSEHFMRKFWNKLSFTLLSKHQKLSESFIEDFSDKVHWEWIFKYQDLSKEFLVKHIDKLNFLNFECLSENTNISEEIKEEIGMLKKLVS